MKTLATNFRLTAVLAEEISESAYLDHNGDTKLEWALTKEVRDAAINQYREQHAEIMADREMLWGACRELGQMIWYQNGEYGKTIVFNKARARELYNTVRQVIAKYDAWETNVWQEIIIQLKAVGIESEPSDHVPDP